MKYEFRWNAHNIEHVARHGIGTQDAEFLIRRARPPYPSRLGDGKFLVIGKLADGGLAQAIFVLDEDEMLYVLHARPLNDSEKQKFRRRHR